MPLPPSAQTPPSPEEAWPPEPSAPAEPPARGGLRGLPSWPLWTAPAAVVFGFMFGALFSIAVDAASGSTTNPGPVASVIADAAFDLAFVLAALWLVWQRGRPRAADFGYRRVSPATALGAFALAAIGYYVLTAIYAVAVNLKGKDKLPVDLNVHHDTPGVVALALFVCVIAPMAEEFFFRGFLFGVLSGIRVRVLGRQLGPWIAAVLTGILFGLAHTGSASSQFLVPLGFLGFVLCLVRWRTGSLYPCMALHSANNALALGVQELNWHAPAIIALMLGSWLVIAVVTGPLGARTPALT